MMTAISIGTVRIMPNRWIALALERNKSKLVACTSSEFSVNEANSSLKNTLRRLSRFKELDETAPSPSIGKMGKRLGQLILGDGEPFSLNEISLKNWSSARLAVSSQLLQVPRGKVISYGGLAKLSNSSPRGVGSIMRSNPVPWAIPCHRVIHPDGRLGKFGGTIGGTKEKARILQAEGVLFNNNGTVNPRAIIF